MEQGLLRFESRIGEMITIHGANVAPLEVEQALSSMAGIERAAVVALPGDTGDLLVAAVVMVPGMALDEDEVRRALKTYLSSFKIPHRIVALDSASVPLTGPGIVRKNLLIPIP